MPHRLRLRYLLPLPVALLGCAAALAATLLAAPQPWYAWGDEKAFWFDTLASTLTILAFSDPIPPAPVAATALLRALLLAGQATLPAMVAVILLLVLWSALVNRLRRFVFCRKGGHVVLVGLGEGGGYFARSVIAHRGRVVALVRSEEARAAGQLGGPHFAWAVGDGGGAGMGPVLARARMAVAVSEDDGRNAAAAAAAAAIAALPGRERAEPLKLVVRIEEPALAANLGIGGAGRRAVELRVLSTAALNARLLLQRMPIDRFRPADAVCRLRFLLLGFGATGQAVLAAYLRLAHFSRGAVSEYVVWDREAVRRRCGFLARFPGAEAIAPIRCERVDFDDDARLDALVERERQGEGTLAGVIVCLNDESAALAAATRVERVLRRKLLAIPPITLVGGRAATVEALASGTLGDNGAWAMVRGLGEPGALFDSELRLLDDIDRVARGLHEAYLADVRAQGALDPALPTHRAWDELDAAVRDDNRAVVDHDGVKLAEWGYRAVERAQAGPTPQLPDAAIEPLAAAEHARWLAGRHLGGWRFAPVRDDAPHLHPDIRSYDELSEATKEKDRAIVRRLPLALAERGLALVEDFRIACAIAEAEADAAAQVVRFRRRLAGWLERNPQRFPVVVSALSSEAEIAIAETLQEMAGAALWLILADPVYILLERLPVALRPRYAALARRVERFLLVAGEAISPEEALLRLGLPAHARWDGAFDAAPAATAERVHPA